MGAKELLENVVAMKASDVFIIAGSPCVVKRDGKIERYNEQRLFPQDTEKLIREIYEIAQKDDIDVFMKTGDDDFSFSIPSANSSFSWPCILSMSYSTFVNYIFISFQSQKAPLRILSGPLGSTIP